MKSAHDATRRPRMRLAHVMASVLQRHPDRPAVGERVKEFTRDATTGRTVLRLLPRYETTSYAELWGRVRAVAGAWHHDPDRPLSAGERVALFGFTSRDYATIDLAAIHLGAVTVPLQTSSATEQLRSIVAETEPSTLATSLERLDAAVELVRDSDSVRQLLVFDYHPESDDHRETLAAARERLAALRPALAVDLLSELLEEGTRLPEAPLYEAPEGEDPLAMLIYTSGSTGTPKGAMYTQRLAGAMWGGAWAKLFDETYAVTFHYMPMSHVAGHSSLKATMVRGGTSYFTASSDLSTFFEDIALARPTELSLVPRVSEMLHQRFLSEADRRTAAGLDRESAEAAAREDIRENVLGGRIAWASNSSAPLSPELTAFVESLLGLELHNVYGSTEAAGVSVDGLLLRPPVLDYRLADVPELGYFRTDSPHPRGELLLRTDAMIPGYYKQPELSAKLFDEDGYYRTGDIVAELGPDRIAIVDRRSNVLKLSQGEFVATSRLEAVFATSPLVRQIFVYGNSERSYLLAVVVPTPEALREHGADHGELKRLLTGRFQELAREAGLNSYEIPRDLLVETEPFSQANGLLSDHRKLLWPRLVKRYGERLEQLYADTTARENAELARIRLAGADGPALETVLRAVRALLAGATAEIGPDAHFRDLGGDSLSAVQLSTLLGETFGVRVPVDVIISPAYDLRHLAEHIEARRADGSDRPTFASVHGEGSTEVHAKDLTLDRFVDQATLAGAATLPPAPTAPRTVLLTGAGGYLGRFLTLQWLERLAPEGGRLIAVIRGKDAAAARARLDTAFDSGDPELVRTFEALAADHLEVVAGDLAEPRLGLDEETWDRLAEEVDLVVHAGALVNHVLPYPELFEANVVGTAELIRLALTRRAKAFTYISSVAVAVAHPGTPLDEDADVRLAMPAQSVDGDGYAGGYATSKWAGEILLREAHEQYGLPVTTFRSNMILAHSRYRGQLNVPDMFTRLLYSVLATGIAPRSFYRADGARAHYDGLPVDFTAAAVVALGGASEEAPSAYRTFSLVNPNDDGVSLDTITDWLSELGHPVERVADHADWYLRFEAAMRSLPEAQRQRSALPILHGYKEPEEPVSGSVIPSGRFRAAVRAGGVEGYTDIPSLNRDFVAKYAADLAALKADIEVNRS
ncbi:carboxylic acid reductase [Streptomyces sp. CBMA291]|uniref:carboxylic acid reductase n=1 Tax=unclassified Streptomyces TaxID=2593676 RepID=UPI0039812B02